MVSITTKITLTILAIILVLGGATGLFFLISEDLKQETSAISGFTPIYCNDYSFTCCVEKLDWTQSFLLTATDALICPVTSTKCEITGSLGWVVSSQQKFRIGSGNCAYSWWGGWSCDRERETTVSPTTIQPGEYIWLSVGVTDIQNKVFKEELIFTGRAGSTIGVPVLGADGCKFNPSATYKDGKLVEYEIGGTSYVVSERQCIQTFVPGDRHICGNIEEQCDSDSDCGGHTYGNQECIGRTLQTYGCTIFGLPIYLEEYGSAIAYKPFEGDNDGIESALSRCEIISAIPVSCCGDSDCGTNAFCDKSTWTCQESAECTQNSDCGVSIQCDRVTKEIKKPVCLSGSCGFEIVENVECCTSLDCASGFFCDSDNTCKESIISKINCPFECCVGEDKYFERSCSSNESCVDNVCQEKGIPIPGECGAWIEIAGKTIVPDLFCIINNWTLKFRIWLSIIIGVLGGGMGISYLLRFLPRESTTKTKIIYSILAFLLLGTALALLALIFFWWIVLLVVVIGIARAVIPGV